MRSALPHPTTGWSLVTAALVVLVAPALVFVVIKGLLAFVDYPYLASGGVSLPPPPPAPRAK